MIVAIATINPATGETLKTFEPLSSAEIEHRIQCATAAFEDFRHVAFDRRARMMAKAAAILEQEKEALGRLMTTEMGKPVNAAMEEALKCAWACRYYAENAPGQLA